MDCQTWREAASLVALVQPSTGSAAIEGMDNKQTSSLMDYVEGRVVLSYNHRAHNNSGLSDDTANEDQDSRVNHSNSECASANDDSTDNDD